MQQDNQISKINVQVDNYDNEPVEDYELYVDGTQKDASTGLIELETGNQYSVRVEGDNFSAEKKIEVDGGQLDTHFKVYERDYIKPEGLSGEYEKRLAQKTNAEITREISRSNIIEFVEYKNNTIELITNHPCIDSITIEIDENGYYVAEIIGATTDPIELIQESITNHNEKKLLYKIDTFIKELQS